MQGFEFEKAMKILVKYFPQEPMKKPTLFHSMRVGSYLWTHNYSENIQIAWLLHDALEDTDMWAEIILENFWKEVLDIVQANSKNTQLPREQMLEDIVKRCSLVWENAMIVKMADIWDNYLFYSQQNNIWELQRCKFLANLVKKYLDKNWNDKIFQKIEIICK